ncbi:MAG: hypothetical protein R3Y38_01350 [Rikenellaceae bacterium]
MKKITALTLALVMSVNLFAQGAQIALIGYGSTTINIVDMQTKKSVWSYKIPSNLDYRGNSIFLLEDGEHLVISTLTSAQVISLKTKEKVWEYRPEGDSKTYEIHGLLPGEDGGFVIFVCKNPVEIIEVSKDFKIKNIVSLSGLKGTTNPHIMSRAVGQDKKGNYLFPWYGEKCIYRISPKGKILDTYDVGIMIFGLRELANGNLLYGAMDESKVCELDIKQNKVVKEIKTFQKQGARAWMQYTAQAEFLGYDKYLVANWTGHFRHHQDTKTSYSPVVMIVDSNGEISWDLTTEQAKAMGLTRGCTGFYYSETPIVK